MLDDAIPSGPKTGELLPSALPDMDSMLGDFARQNPSLAWLTQMIAAQRQQAAGANAPSDVDPLQAEIDALTEELAHAEARAEKLRRIGQRLCRDLDAAQGLLADLAAAFGACGLCWGEDDTCRSCRGRGKPGRFAPDPALRLRFFAERLELPAASGTSTPSVQS